MRRPPLLPSVVHFPAEGGVVVGRTAVARASREPKRTLASVKRLMGRGADDAETTQLASYRFAVATNDEERRIVRFDTGARIVTPVEVAAEILKSLRQSALDQLRKIGGVVITVPAYFDDAQRQATRDAGKLAASRCCGCSTSPRPPPSHTASRGDKTAYLPCSTSAAGRST